MKTTLLFAILAAGFSAAQEHKVAPATATTNAVPKVPRKAADIGIQIAPETYVWLSHYSGKTCIVAVILTTCSHCQFTTGILNKVAKDYADKDIQILATAIEPMSSLHIGDFEKTYKPAFPVGYNEQGYVAKFLDLPPDDPMLVPQLVFIDKSGTVRAQFAGDDAAMTKDIQEKNIREALEKTLKAK